MIIVQESYFIPDKNHSENKILIILKTLNISEFWENHKIQNHEIQSGKSNTQFASIR